MGGGGWGDWVSCEGVLVEVVELRIGGGRKFGMKKVTMRNLFSVGLIQRPEGGYDAT